MNIHIDAHATISIDPAVLDQLVDDPTDTAAVQREIQRMVDAGDLSVIHGWERHVDIGIEVAA